MARQEKQQTLEATLGESALFSRVLSTHIQRPRLRSQLTRAKRATATSRLKQSSTRFGGSSTRAGNDPIVIPIASSSSDEGGKSKKGAEIELPVRPSPKRRGAALNTAITVSSIATSSSQAKLHGSDDDSSNDNKPLYTPSSTRLARKRNIVIDDSDDGEQELQLSSPLKRRRLVRRGEAASSPPAPTEREAMPEILALQLPSSSAVAARRKPRTKKEKAMELLRRKRAGETITEVSESSEEDDDVKGVYDTDPEHEALSEFEDDDEGVLQYKEPGNAKGSSRRKSSKSKSRTKMKAIDDDNNSDGGAANSGSDDMSDFVVDDGDAPFGVPDSALHEMPLQFTAYSKKPQIVYFRNVLEWIVQRKINPGFDRQHGVYRMAWQKLDDEVQALGTGRASSVWRRDFEKALRARPYFTSVENRGFDAGLQSCGACGRSGHPASFEMTFSGKAYYKKSSSPHFLEDIETSDSPATSQGSDSGNDDRGEDGEESENDKGSEDEAIEEDEADGNDEEGDDGDGNDGRDVDDDNNIIPEEGKMWYIGSQCHENAAIAHSLIHWKHEVMDYVDSQLIADGQMSTKKVVKRANLKPKKLNKKVDKIMANWQARGIISNFHGQFKANIEKSRSMPSGGRWRKR
ncbi:hypothetical protein B0H63DRAFT_496484 [Podospora didyma]|uniref:DUF4211 domain-containing protein n=1 Tax=Podospora didyma TaxID=330526 RepID=A0AAE0KFK4_9PEZI|nr:hypothetical protein B0H63DRAFT_496484 [Podospora didyma]